MTTPPPLATRVQYCSGCMMRCTSEQIIYNTANDLTLFDWPEGTLSFRYESPAGPSITLRQWWVWVRFCVREDFFYRQPCWIGYDLGWVLRASC
jgi:hypothetical protein